MAFELTKEQVAEMLKGNKNADAWYNAMVEILPKYDINTISRIAGFIAQCKHESTNFTELEENLHYKAETLDKIFPKYFGKNRKSADYAMKPEMIANVVYASRLGNGDTASGDGYNFRGRGIIQLTGRDNYAAFGKSIGKTAEEVIPYLSTIEGALESACWYWNSRKINAACDAHDITKMTKLINGGLIGLEDRTTYYNDNLIILNTIAKEEPKVVAVKPAKVATRVHVFDLNTSINLGSRGDLVIAVQNKLGVNPADGIFGQDTRRAVKDYQSKNGMRVDGVAGPDTLKKLLG